MVSVSKPSAVFFISIRRSISQVCHFDQKKTSVNETRTQKLILQQLANNYKDEGGQHKQDDIANDKDERFKCKMNVLNMELNTKR